MQRCRYRESVIGRFPIGLKPEPRPTDNPLGMPMTLTLLITSVAIGFELALGICTGAILRNVARTRGGEESVSRAQMPLDQK